MPPLLARGDAERDGGQVMERLVQLLDYLEDLFFALPLIAERIRDAVLFCVFIILSIALQAFAVLLALSSPPMALAVASLMMVGMLYRGVVGYAPRTA